MQLFFVLADEFQAVTFDATIRENHGTSAEATEHPVEQGAPVSDNVREERDRLSVEVHVTNTPVVSPNVDGANGEVRQLQVTSTGKSFTRLANAKRNGEVEQAQREDNTRTLQAMVLQFANSFDRCSATYNLLTGLCKNGIELTIVTSLRQYDSMVIVDITAPRDAPSRHSIKFQMELVEMRFANSETVDSPEPLETRAERSRRRGAQGAQENTQPVERSMAAALLEDHAGIGLIHSTRPNGNSLFR